MQFWNHILSLSNFSQCLPLTFKVGPSIFVKASATDVEQFRFTRKSQHLIFLAVPRQFNRWQCHWVSDSHCSRIVEIEFNGWKICEGPLWETWTFGNFWPQQIVGSPPWPQQHPWPQWSVGVTSTTSTTSSMTSMTSIWVMSWQKITDLDDFN